MGRNFNDLPIIRFFEQFPAPANRSVELSGKIVTRDTSAVSNFVLFKNIDQFRPLFGEIESEYRHLILIILLFFEGRLRKTIVTTAMCNALLRQYSRKPILYNRCHRQIKKLVNTKILVIVARATKTLSSEILKTLIGNNIEVTLKYHGGEQKINFTPLVEHLKNTPELQVLYRNFCFSIQQQSNNPIVLTNLNPLYPSVNEQSQIGLQNSSVERMRISALLSPINDDDNKVQSPISSENYVDEPESTELELLTFDTSFPINWTTESQNPILSTQENPISFDQDLVDINQEISFSHSISAILSGQVNSVSEKPLSTQENPILLSSMGETEQTEREPGVNTYFSIEQSTANQIGANELLIPPHADISDYLGDFLLLNRLDEFKNDFEEMKFIFSDELDKIYSILLFIKAQFDARPVNIQTCCATLALYDNKLRDDRYVARIQRNLINEKIIQEDKSGFYKLTEKFLKDLEKQEAKVTVLINNSRREIPIQPFIKKLLELYSPLNEQSINTAMLELNISEQIELPQQSSFGIVSTELETADLNLPMNSLPSNTLFQSLSVIDEETAPINLEPQQMASTVNLKKFPLPKRLENFVLLKEKDQVNQLVEQYFPHTQQPHLVPVHDMVLIVLLLLEKYLLETPSKQIVIKDRQIVAMLSYFDNKSRNNGNVRDKLRFLTSAQVISSHAVNGKATKRELANQFLDKLKNNYSKVMVTKKGKIEEIDIRKFIEKLINISEELQELAKLKGLGCYVISKGKQLRNIVDIHKNDGDGPLNNVLFKNLVSGTDFLDSLLEDSQDENLRGIFSDSREQTTDNPGKRKQLEKTIEEILEEQLREENARLKRQRKAEESVGLQQETRDQILSFESETEINVNVSDFLANMNSALLGSISIPLQALVETPPPGQTDTDLDEIFNNLLLP